ncbi:hypothetical protein ACWIG4_27220 [Streptomyces sp. NPDC002248]
MNTTSRPAAGLATENFDSETFALLEAVKMPLPEFGDLDLDVAFGTPLEMFKAGVLSHERLVDVLLPYAAQLRVSRPAKAVPLPLAA